MLNKEFIEVTAMSDGRRAAIRAASIVSVLDNAEQRSRYGIRYSYRTIVYSGHTLDVIESYDDICEMIYNAEL